MGLGLLLGWAFPTSFDAIADLSVAQVNPVTALLVWLLIIPSMVGVRYGELTSIWRAPSWRRASALTLAINWVIKPLSLTLLAVLFLRIVFAPLIPADQAEGYIAGLILLGIAPCAGMVFVWSRMTGGDPAFTLAQVSLNNLVLLVAFVPLAGLLMGVSGLAIPWATLGISVFAFVVAPAFAGIALSWILQRAGLMQSFQRVTGRITKAGLLLLVAVLFGLQADTILSAPFVIALIAVPLLVQTVLIFVSSILAARMLVLPKPLAAPATLIGVSNFFELAIAVAIGMFGATSPAVTATIVGVLIEVPVMLLLVTAINHWWSEAAPQRAALEQPS